MQIAFLTKSENMKNSIISNFDKDIMLFDNIEDLQSNIEKIEVLITSNMGFPCNAINSFILSKAERLKIIQNFGVSTDVIDVDEATKRNIPVAILPATNSVSVAELGIHLLFCLAKQVRKSEKAILANNLGEPLCEEVYGKKACVIGLGRIGTALSLRINALGMNVVAVTKDIQPGQGKICFIDEIYPPEQIIEGIKDADYIFLTLPLTEETEDLFNEKLVINCQRRPYLINITRAPIVNKEFIYEALKNGLLRGYATDVFWEEPINKDDPFLSLDNFVITPHIGATTVEVIEESIKLIKENIFKLEKGESPLYLINNKFLKGGDK
ncbi:MAG: hypothetical protein JM58_12245 [Peptococcaceae bacterium BICA1-8]|nr:MAG: hypothetical protein JM58_12245 [Peptococcaceae bacterium BICA1-8]